MSDDRVQLLEAIDAAHRLAIKLGEKDLALLLLKAGLDVSQKIEAQNARIKWR